MNFIFLAIIFVIPHIVAYQYNKSAFPDFCKVTWEPWCISIGLVGTLLLMGVL